MQVIEREIASFHKQEVPTEVELELILQSIVKHAYLCWNRRNRDDYGYSEEDYQQLCQRPKEW